MIARLRVEDGTLTEYPIAEKVKGGWQNGVTFYADENVTEVTPLTVSAGRIDHACEARRLLQVERSDAASALGWDSADAQHAATLAEAQVHATLALIEQQRIANLIAMFSLSEEDASDAADLGFDYLAAAKDIREGLGL